MNTRGIMSAQLFFTALSDHLHQLDKSGGKDAPHEDYFCPSPAVPGTSCMQELYYLLSRFGHSTKARASPFMKSRQEK